MVYKLFLWYKYEEITDILKKIENVVYMNNVFISGSAEQFDLPWSKESAEDLAYQLSKTLVNRDYKITSGFGLGIGSSIINRCT